MARSRSRRGRRGRPRRERSVDLTRYETIVPDWPAFLEAAARREPTVFRVRVGRIDEDALVERLTAQGFDLRALDGMPTFYQVERGPYPISSTVEHWLGLVYVQQASTGIAAPAMGSKPGERVLDLCAAPGGKTTHMAELMADTGCLVANEISESRIRGLLGNVYRLGHSNVLVTAADGRDFPEGPLFDRVLIDAPCSGEGTLRRRGGQAPNQSASFVRYVTDAQRGLLEKAVRLTRPGGVILYVTCTFAPEENEAVVSDALARLPVELESLDLPVPHAPGVVEFDGQAFDPRVEGAARVYPHHLDSGGLFLAKLRRLDGEVDATDTAWSPLPSAFPDPHSHDVAPSASPSDTSSELIRRAVDEVTERFEIDLDEDRVSWIVRGGRIWLHTVDAWPLPAWEDGEWRPVSVGLRAIELDSRGRARPTNDFLRWASAHRTMISVDDHELTELLNRRAVPTEREQRGPVVLGYRGDVLGRGAVTGDGLKSEIPKARAADLLRALFAHQPE